MKPSLVQNRKAVANGTLEHYSTCDWIDNAIVLHMEKSAEAIYGQMHLPCRVAVNERIGAAPPAVGVVE